MYIYKFWYWPCCNVSQTFIENHSSCQEVAQINFYLRLISIFLHNNDLFIFLYDVARDFPPYLPGPQMQFNAHYFIPPPLEFNELSTLRKAVFGI